MKINILHTTAEATEKEFLDQAVSIIEQVTSTPNFKKEVLALEMNKGIDNAEVYKAIMKPITINEVDFYDRDTKVLGMAYERTGRISLNRPFWNEGKLPINASVLFHEALHLIGFDHINSLDHASVPYAVGNLLKRMIVTESYKLKRSTKILLWLRFFGIKLIEGIFILFAFFSGAVILAHFLKHVCKINILPFKLMLNDTVDGDYGGDWWLKEKGLNPSLWSAFRWWFRNPCWNFKLLFQPKNHANANIIEVVKNEVRSPFTWVNQKDRGVNFLYYEAEGALYFRYSYSNNYINIQAGTSGKRRNLKLRASR